MAYNAVNSDLGIWLDPAGFEHLKNRAREDSPEALRAAAQQFEAKFVAMMLASMRATVPEGGLLSGHDQEYYMELLDRQLAHKMVRSGGFGLTEAIVRQLEHRAGGGAGDKDTAEAVAIANSVSSKGVAERLQSFQMPERLGSHSTDRGGLPGSRAYPPVTTTTGTRRASEAGIQHSQQQFVREVLPHARRAGRALGVAPEVLVAQAALETGWGRYVIRHPDGRSSFNLFNIKAHDGWSGEAVTVTTLEYSDGIPERVRARFRAYTSPAESFADYVRLIGHQPRYAPALAQAGDAHGYLRALQAAGYATDPVYADKVIKLLGHPAISGVSQSLKDGRDMPTSSTDTASSAASESGRG